MDQSRQDAIRRVMRAKSVNYATAKRLVDNALKVIENGIRENIRFPEKAKHGEPSAINN